MDIDFVEMFSFKKTSVIYFFKGKATEDNYCFNCGYPIAKQSLVFINRKLDNNNQKKYLCINCKMCPNLHNLGKFYFSKVEDSENTNCSICKRSCERGIGLHCIPCNYFVCSSCNDKYFTHSYD